MRATLGLLAVVLALVSASLASTAEPRPAVLVVGDIHARYAARPLHEMGVELDVCGPGDLAARLAAKRYNVAVVLANDPVMQKPLEAFLAAGGGVYVAMPFGHISRQDNWFPNPEWAAQQGARLRWEQLQETDPANAYTDFMGAPMSWSTQIAPPVNEGVKQVLILVSRLGWWPPLGFDFSDEWTVVVRFAPSVKGTAPENIPERLRAYIPAQPSPGSQPLLAVRQVGPGRLAISGISGAWSLSPPAICPTVEAMLSAGAQGKQSDWLRLYANLFRWLAEPSLRAGFGGAVTPERVLNPAEQWEDHPPIPWDTPELSQRIPPMGDAPQLRGLVGARTSLSSGMGTVADYAKAARAAGLSFIVFLEDALKMDAAKFEQLVAECRAASDATFAAIPGLTYEDAQGNHLYSFGDNTKFPRPEMVLPDGRLATTTVSRTEVMFKYIFEYQNYRNVFGFWNHRNNFLAVPDYKFYNSFVVYSFADGKPVDDAFAEYQYLMGWSGCQPIFAFEIVTSPDQVARRARDGWKVVAAIPGQFGDGTYVQSAPPEVESLRKKWIGSLGWWPPFQYITNGPEILSWSCQNICVVPSGEWWRPDLWQYRAHLHVTSDQGLKSVVIYDGDRGIFRRWLPNGAREFTHDLILAHDRQRDLFLAVDDLAGRRAISMEIWNRNTLNNQLICGDRCNFLGDRRLRRKDGSQFWLPVGMRPNMGLTPSKGSMKEALWMEPATALTPGAPTLPIDGKPLSWPSPRIEIGHAVPGEYQEIHTWPTTYLLSPEIGIGQANYRLAYDPAEYGATKTPLGHDYQVTEQKLPDGTVNVIPQGQIGKNAWTSWYRLVPTKVLDGWSRLISSTVKEEVRFGGYQAHLVFKQEAAFEPDKGMSVLTAGGEWDLYLNGNPVELSPAGEATGAFGRGAVAVQMSPGGSVALAGEEGRLRFRRTKVGLTLTYLPENNVLRKGETADVTIWWAGFSGLLSKEQVLKTMADFGVLMPGTVSYAAKSARGETLDTYLFWRLAASEGAVEARVPQADLLNYIPVAVTGMQDNCSAFILDRARPAGSNFRAIPVQDGVAYTQVDVTEGDADLFIGHPVLCDQAEVKVLVSWRSPGRWFVEAHNPTDRPLTARLRANRGWDLFRFEETATLSPGTSQVWDVRGTEPRAS